MTIRYFRNQIRPDITASVDYGLSGTWRHPAHSRRGIPGTHHRPGCRATTARCSATSSPTRFRPGRWPSTSAIRSGRAPRRPAWRGPGAVQPVTDADQEPGTAGRHAGPHHGPAGHHQPAACADHPRFAGTRRASARRRAAEARRRNLDQLRRVPGCSAIWRWRATTNCARCSTSTSRWSTSIPFNRRRSPAAPAPSERCQPTGAITTTVIGR